MGEDGERNPKFNEGRRMGYGGTKGRDFLDIRARRHVGWGNERASLSIKFLETLQGTLYILGDIHAKLQVQIPLFGSLNHAITVMFLPNLGSWPQARNWPI